MLLRAALVGTYFRLWCCAFWPPEMKIRRERMGLRAEETVLQRKRFAGECCPTLHHP